GADKDVVAGAAVELSRLRNPGRDADDIVAGVGADDDAAGFCELAEGCAVDQRFELAAAAFENPNQVVPGGAVDEQEVAFGKEGVGLCDGAGVVVLEGDGGGG